MYLTFSLPSCQKQKDKFCILIHSAIMCLLIRDLKQIIFKVIIKRTVLIVAIFSAVVFLVVDCVSVIIVAFIFFLESLSYVYSSLWSEVLLLIISAGLVWWTRILLACLFFIGNFFFLLQLWQII